jgi:hypothetical protein
MSWTPTFDGYALDDSNGVTVENATELPGVRGEYADMLTAGTVTTRRAQGGRVIELEGKLVGTSAANFETRLDALLGALMVAEGGYLQLSDDRRIFAYPEPGGFDLLRGSSNMAGAWACRFQATAAWWESTTEQSEVKTYASSASISDSYTTTLTTSAAPANIKIQVEQDTPGAARDLDLLIKNRTADPKEWVRLKDAVLAGAAGLSDILIIDPETESGYFSGVTTGASALPRRAEGAGLRVHPGGSQTFTIDSLSSDGNLKITLTTRALYASSGF